MPGKMELELIYERAKELAIKVKECALKDTAKDEL